MVKLFNTKNENLSQCTRRRYIYIYIYVYVYVWKPNSSSWRAQVKYNVFTFGDELHGGVKNLLIITQYTEVLS